MPTATRIELHPVTPQSRFIRRIHEILEKDGLIIYPLDSGYALGCSARSRKAANRLYQLKGTRTKYLTALVAADFSMVSEFAKVDNYAYRYMKHMLPGPYTFILPVAHQGKRILDVNRTEVGIRMPNSAFLAALYEIDPSLVLLATSARVSDEEAIQDPDDIEAKYAGQVDAIVDMGPIPVQPTTIISLVGGQPEVLREGAGPIPG